VGARGVTGASSLYPLLAYGDERIVRLAFAEATGFAYEPVLSATLVSGRGGDYGYFEAQIHGDLSWSNLEQIVIRHTEDGRSDAERDRDRLQAYADKQGLRIRVELSRVGDPSPGRMDAAQEGRDELAELEPGRGQGSPEAAFQPSGSTAPKTGPLYKSDPKTNVPWGSSTFSASEYCVEVTVIPLRDAGGPI